MSPQSLPGALRRNLAPHDLLVALHGHGSDRWQFIRDGRDECRGTREAAARHGAILVSPDYRAPTSWMGPKAEADLVQIDGLRHLALEVKSGATVQAEWSRPLHKLADRMRQRGLDTRLAIVHGGETDGSAQGVAAWSWRRLAEPEPSR